MRLPNRIPGLKWLIILWGAYGIVWIAFEGTLWRVLLLGFLTTAVALLSLIQKQLGGHTLSALKWVGLTAVSGVGLGLGTAVLTLIFMALKSGLHAHGPEFRPQEITWLLQQTPLWTAVGLLAGLGLGLITSQLKPNTDNRTLKTENRPPLTDPAAVPPTSPTPSPTPPDVNWWLHRLGYVLKQRALYRSAAAIRP